MSFMDSKFSKWGEVETAVLSQSLAKRFARVMLAAVLAASFLPVAAFADAPAISGPNQIKYYMTAQYTNGTSRSEYNWTWSSEDGGAIEISSIDKSPNGQTVSVTGTELGHVTLMVSGGDADEERFEIEITKRDVRLSSSSDYKIYDGTPLTIGGISVDGDGWAPLDEDGVRFNITGSQTNAGESENTFDVVLPLGSEEYFEKHYNISIRYGVLRVEKRPVTLTSASGSKEYDGKPLTNHEVTVGEAAWGTGWVDGQGATYSFAGSQKIVGASENTFECIPNEGTNLDNYQINKTYGTLTVTDRSEKYQITLTPNSKSATYDGTEKSVSGFETLEFQINGQTFYVSGVEASATGTDAGEYPVTKSGQAVVTDAEGNDVTDQFIVNIDDAKLTIVEGNSDKSVSNLPHTGDSAALYLMGICAVVLTAGAGALFTFRKRNNYK
ncbi:LPXTG cell wall anchor domain-containing protein [Collinsella sp. LCP19S3_G12]|uniref:LPXTG cell wall anchor domain-containing protein n=1 Tax=unclassified Collinsella TaxID=2637548 RepID=UPI003F8E45E8